MAVLIEMLFLTNIAYDIERKSRNRNTHDAISRIPSRAINRLARCQIDDDEL